MKNTCIDEILYTHDIALFGTGDKDKKRTKAITLRIEKWWLKKLEKISHKLSLENNHKIGVQDLIREATRRVFITEDIRTILKKEGIMSEREKLQYLKSSLAS